MKHLIIIGGQRCGTTYLFHLLDTHPQISMAKPWHPEPKFFLTHSKATSEEYRRALFKGHDKAQHALWLGEKSTGYYDNGTAARSMASTLPDCIIVLCLRDPVKRALSNHRFTRMQGLESRSIRETFLNKLLPPPLSMPISIDPFAYLERGHYFRCLDTYCEVFSRERLVLIKFEELIKDDLALTPLAERLGIDPYGFVHSDHLERNATEAEPADEEVEAMLREHYASSNRILAEKYAFNIDGWSAG